MHAVLLVCLLLLAPGGTQGLVRPSPLRRPAGGGLRPRTVCAASGRWWQLPGKADADKEDRKGSKAVADVAGGEDEDGGDVPQALKSLLQFMRRTLPFVSGMGTGVALAAAIIFAPGLSLDVPTRNAIVLFEEVLTEIQRAYVDELDVKRLSEGAMDSMLSTLDPYTSLQRSEQLDEQVNGRYGGVGLVISEPLRSKTRGPKAGPAPGSDGSAAASSAAAAPAAAKEAAADGERPGGPATTGSGTAGTLREDNVGVVVVNAFPGYAWDAGVRVGDRIESVDGTVTRGKTLDEVRDLLRGEPGTTTTIKVLRDTPKSGPAGEAFDIPLDRKLVKVDDVRTSVLWGKPEDGIAYIQLASFGSSAAQDLARSLITLDQQSGGLKGVVLDLRGNPGGLLGSAVEVASMLVPEGSTIVSASGRAFDTVTYKSRAAPLRPLELPLVIMVNDGTASAAEIVSGAVQDLDSGAVVGIGEGRTFGKGLVQEVEEIGGGNSIKYTIAKYYTPSGRCIQRDTYKREAGSNKGYTARRFKDDERKTFYTANGRPVREGGGIEADVKVAAPRNVPLIAALQSQGAFFDFAGEWGREHDFRGFRESGGDEVLDAFEKFVLRSEREGKLRLDAAVPQIEDIEKALGEAGLGESEAALAKVRAKLRDELKKGLREKEQREDIRVVLREAIAARYLPDTMLQLYNLEDDLEFQAALRIVKDGGEYSRILTGNRAGKVQLADKSIAKVLDPQDDGFVAKKN